MHPRQNLFEIRCSQKEHEENPAWLTVPIIIIIGFVQDTVVQLRQTCEQMICSQVGCKADDYYA